MDTHSTAGPSAYPNQRSPLVQKAALPSSTVNETSIRLGTQTAGLDQRLVGAVNASRIAALSGPQGATSGERSPRPSDGVADVYRRTQMVTTPTPASRLAS